MSTFFGTNENDNIDGASLPAGTFKVDPKQGNDTLININSVEVVASPGSDDISGNDIRYLLWYAKEPPVVDLSQGYAQDGFGFRDTLSGVTTVQLPSTASNPVDATVIGSDSDETVYVFAGNNKIDLGNGTDKVLFYNSKSTDYELEKKNGVILVKNLETESLTEITGTEFIEFRPEKRIIDANYFDSAVRANLSNIIYSFTDTTQHEGFDNNYGYTSPGLINWATTAIMNFDIDQDEIADVIVPMFKGYQTNIDNRTPFIALTSKNGTLEFDQSVNSLMPITNAARRAEPIVLEPSKELAYVTVNHDMRNGSIRFSTENPLPSELTFVTTTGSKLNIGLKLPPLPNAYDAFPRAVNAHALATGDMNGDGLDDIFVGHQMYNQALNKTPQDGSGYALLQNKDGTFTLDIQPVFKKITLTGQWADDVNLLDLHLTDVNNDGYDDLIAGWGHGKNTSSFVFLSNSGSYSEAKKIALPNSIYGENNQLHLKTLSSDLDHDGDNDLVIQWSRFDPYYSGNYIQVLQNDGEGNFTDITDKISGSPYLDAYAKSYVEHWQLIDVNNDGHMDIAGSIVATSEPLIFLNDGKARFETLTVSTDWTKYSGSGLNTIAFGDYDNDDILELVKFTHSKETALSKSSTNSFLLFELSGSLGTGPNYANSATLKVPGFNEKYYLNTHPTASEALEFGTYSSGLKHYLAEGKKAGLSAFAPFTRISGSSDVDVLTLPKKSTDYLVDTSQETWAITEKLSTAQYSVTDIERVAFSDKNFAYDISGNAGKTLKLLGALAGKEAAMNKNYIGEGLKLLYAGMPYERLMELAVNAILGTNPTGSEVVALLYRNAAGVEAPQAVLDDYGILIDSGATTVSQLAMSVAEHSINESNLDLVGLSTTGVEYLL